MASVPSESPPVRGNVAAAAAAVVVVAGRVVVVGAGAVDVTVTVTAAVSHGAVPSVTVEQMRYVNVSVPVKPAFGVYRICPFSTAAVPLVGGVATASDA